MISYASFFVIELVQSHMTTFLVSSQQYMACFEYINFVAHLSKFQNIFLNGPFQFCLTFVTDSQQDTLLHLVA